MHNSVALWGLIFDSENEFSLMISYFGIEEGKAFLLVFMFSLKLEKSYQMKIHNYTYMFEFIFFISIFYYLSSLSYILLSQEFFMSSLNRLYSEDFILPGAKTLSLRPTFLVIFTGALRKCRSTKYKDTSK